MRMYRRSEVKRPPLKPREQVQTVLGSLRRLTPLLWRLAPGRLAASVLFHTLQAAIPALQLYITKLLVDAVAVVTRTGPTELRPAYVLLAFQAALHLGGAGLRAVQRLNAAHLQRRATYYLEDLVAGKAARLPLTFFDRPDFYDQLQRARGGLGQRGLGVMDATLQVIQSLLTVVSYLVVLARMHWILAAAVALLAGPVLLVNLRMGDWRFWQMRRQTPTARRTQYLMGLLTGREAAGEVRVFSLQEYLQDRWRGLFWQTAGEQLALERRFTWSRLAAEGGGAAAATGAAGFLLWLGAHGRLTLGDYVALAGALLSAQNMMQMVAFHLARIYEDALFTTDLFSFLALPEESPPPAPRPFPAPLRRGIDVENLSFSYPDKPRPALTGVSFHIRSGEKVAIVGENGAGKTTLVKCLLGLYRPQTGTIRYDGVDIRDIDAADLRSHVTAIFQDFVRYQLTLRDNIGFGRVERRADDLAIQAAAGRGGADAVVNELPRGYETELGPVFAGGHELSHGQWQKVALSRAFFREAAVIVLDEPTAALDPRAEAAVFERFAQLTEGRTALLISHRLGTCRSADRILVLRGGRLVEAGHHDELIVRDGEYARMFRQQAQWYTDVPLRG